MEVLSNDDLSIARDLDKYSWRNDGVRTVHVVKKTNYIDKDKTTGMKKTMSVVEDDNVIVIQYYSKIRQPKSAEKKVKRRLW